MSSFVVLGIQGNYARMRMFVNDQEVDEDFILPELPEDSGIPKTAEVYKYLLTKDIETRMIEIDNKLTDASKSTVPSLEKIQAEQFIKELSIV